jgi:hypothetical protein
MRHSRALLAAAALLIAPVVHGESRSALSAAALTDAQDPGPWSMAAFSPPSDSAQAPSRNIFEGRLQLVRELAQQDFSVLLDRYGDAAANAGAATHLPEFDFEFVQSGDALIPARRGALASAHPAWEFILEPGRVWDEAGDGEYSRAALPFTLEERNANCMHNGVLTFLFRSDGSISNVAFEIAHETCAYFRFNWWGYSKARYIPHALPAHDELVARFREEVRLRLPLRPIAALKADFPGARPERFASALEVPPSTLTTYGLIVDGRHYAGECATRFGPYPFCDVLDLPSYSLAKSIVGGMALMRLSVTDSRLPDALINTWVPQCSARRGWSGVTLKNALDLATGHYLSAVPQHDENGSDMLAFFLPDDHAEKLKFACTHYPRRVQPGTQWVYHTADTYLLGTALNAWYRSRAGQGADFYRDVLVMELWPALHLSPVLDVPRRTYDSAAQPFAGYGVTLHRDDIAKIGVFLNVDHGRSGADQLLDPKMLDGALQRDPNDVGLPAGAPDLRYNHGFWAWNAQRALGCAQPTWIPFMSGYGGIVVALLPNGMVYYQFSDGGVFKWAMAAAEADHIRPICRK